MPLRSRLSLLYITLLGGILLLFGVGVYSVVNFMLLRQLDEILIQTAADVISNTRINNWGAVSPVIQRMDINSNAVIQFWDREGQLTFMSTIIGTIQEPLDEQGLSAVEPVFRDVTFLDNIRLRVYSVPLTVNSRPVGVLQVATSLTLVDTARRDLLYIIVIFFLVSILLAAVTSFYAIGTLAEPLQAATEVAQQITRADDLSRRIPYSGSPDDEIGRLINSFNETLERLETLFSSQQRFLADVSHEFRTPLTVIKGNVDLMRRMKTLDEESLGSIEAEANRLARLVGDLLLLAQAESGKLPLNLTCVELDTLLLEVFQEMHVLAKGKVSLTIAEIDQVQVDGDRDRLKQVLINLISNAIQYTPAGGRVTLGLSKTLEVAAISVADTGPGIPEKDLPHIFDRFYRAEKSRTRSKASGFGLGLSIAYWIVDHHGGRIEVNSKEGQGTTFLIYLPLCDEHTVDDSKMNSHS